MLRARGAVVFSADEAARAVLTVNGRTLAAIALEFGPDILLPNGSLDRARLAKRIFGDSEARLRLNRLMHPPILRLLRAQIDAAWADLPPDTVIAVEAPLLFEARMQDWFDRIIVVTAPANVQEARLRARDGLTEADARRRPAAQMPLREKAARADIVVNNDDSLSRLQETVTLLWRRLREEAQAAGKIGPRPMR